MSLLIGMLNKFQDEHELLKVKYPSSLNCGGHGNFTIYNKQGETFKFFIQYRNDYNLSMTIVPQARLIKPETIPEPTFMQSYCSIQKCLDSVLAYYEMKDINTQYPNSIKFIMGL